VRLIAFLPAGPQPSARARNAAATRQAILASARRAFARAGYDGAGVREIAGGAGVTAMLVNRYFGSKERLFAEVVADTMATPDILSEENLRSSHRAEQMAATLVDITAAGAAPLDGFLIMLKSASSERAAEIAREQIEEHYHKVLTAALTGKAAPQRAAVALALVAGVQVMRQMIALSALAEADRADLAPILTPLFTQLISGTG
jgi:AcrR family transcriptional regulator